MRAVRALAAPLLLLAACAATAGAEPTAAPMPRATPPERPVAADLGSDRDVLLKSIRAELTRAAASLALGKLEKPYYLEALVSDQLTLELMASFGAMVTERSDRSRPLRVLARVGSYELDNSEFFSSSRSFSGSGSDNDALGIEDEEPALRRDLWLAFDAAYKLALEELAAKRAALQNRVIRNQLPDFSRQQPVVALYPRLDIKLTPGAWQAELRRLSAIFREYPAVQDSNVMLRLQVANRYFVSSEGTATRQPVERAMLLVQATAQASDGMTLRNFLPIFATTAGELPPEAELARRVRDVAEELSAMTTAPVLDEYVGPVLFTEQAAAELIAQVLVPELSGQRPPLFEEERMADMAPRSELSERINRMVLPPFLSATDDPTVSRFAFAPLIGGFSHDDQGVPAQRVNLIEDGRLKTLLMTRRPRKDLATSNGHGRAEPYGGVSAHIGNLFLTTNAGQTDAELKAKLIALARDAGLDHALLVRRIEDGGLLSGGDGPSHSFRLGRHGLGNGLSDTVLAYRVAVADGSEELLRGVSLGGITARTLREIVAAGTREYVDNRFATFTGNMFAFYGGAPTDIGVPCTVIAPALLLPDVELAPHSGEQERPVLLRHPFFEH